MKISRNQIDGLMLNCGIQSYSSLAEKANISRQNLSTVLRRESCSGATLIKLATALNINPAELLPDTNERGA